MNKKKIQYQFQPKDIEASESHRLERIQAARRIRRSKSAPSSARSGSVSVNTEEETTSTCLPNIFKMQQKSDKHKDREKEETCADIPSPSSDPPPYESVGGERKDSAAEGIKNYQDDGTDLRDDSTVPLLGLCEQNRRYVQILSAYSY